MTHDILTATSGGEPMQNEPKKLSVFDVCTAASRELWIGTSPEDVVEQLDDCYGEGHETWLSYPVKAVRDETVLPIGDATKTCAEWVRANGRGLLASKER